MLRKEYEKYVNILPSDTLKETLVSTQKVEIGKSNKERTREDYSSEEEKGKSLEITKDDLNALRQEIEELPIGNRKFRTHE